MASRPKYNTRQKKILLDYLKTVEGVHITAGDVCDHFKEKGAPIGQSTVYRQLECLVDEGVLNKYIIDANSPACFEYVSREEHGEGGHCFHCKCEKCGTLIHLHCEEAEDLLKHISAEHSFYVDTCRTVFYGLCENCAEKGERSCR
ncbi:MAG: transcriptional repressor [Lachnospiraceae bacterium]|nr:transcriptional repressor [Lachnospiraceae bacterium]